MLYHHSSFYIGFNKQIQGTLFAMESVTHSPSNRTVPLENFVIRLGKILILLTFTSVSQASEMAPQYFEKQIEMEISDINTKVDMYFEQMISIKAALSNQGLKITSSQEKLGPEATETIINLESLKSEIFQDLHRIRTAIEQTTLDQISSEEREFLKFQFDLVIIKSFLPRYQNVTPEGVLGRIFYSYKPQQVDSIIGRSEALNLFFTEFEINANSKDALNAEYRAQVILRTYNEIAGNFNSNRESNLFQIYPKNLKLKSLSEEILLYQNMINGEEFKADKTSTLQAKDVEVDRFVVTFTCSKLFNL